MPVQATTTKRDDATERRLQFGKPKGLATYQLSQVFFVFVMMAENIILQ
jgi:hypothetical protein